MSSVQKYKGLYYSGHDKSSVTFTVSDQGVIKFDTERGRNVDIILNKTTLNLIGDPETTLQICWHDDAKLLCSLLCYDPKLFDRLLATHVLPEVSDQLYVLQEKQRQQAKHEHYRVPLYMSYILVFFFATYFMYSYSVPLVTQLIPYEWEKKIGAFAFENYQTGKSVVDHPLVGSAMHSIVRRIDDFDAADIDYEVVVVDAEMLNAFAFPGGYIVVTSGLINSSDNPEEVAAVLSHEITHVLERHGMRKLVRQAGLGILIGIVFGDVSALSQLMELSSHLDSLSFDRSQEEQADEGGIKIMQAAGISPQNLVSFFNKIRDFDSVSGDIPEIFRTHPLTDDRIKRVISADEPAQIIEFDLDWEQVKLQVKQKS